MLYVSQYNILLPMGLSLLFNHCLGPLSIGPYL
jgi:hypothetical protein